MAKAIRILQIILGIIIALLFLIGLFASIAFAEINPELLKPANDSWNYPRDHTKIMIGAGLLIAGTIADVESSFNALQRCKGCFEGNPFPNPYVGTSRWKTYAIRGAMDAGLIWLAWKFPRFWWIPTIIPAASYAGAAIYHSVKF